MELVVDIPEHALIGYDAKNGTSPEIGKGGLPTSTM